MQTAIAYLRASTAEQNLSPAAQREAIEAWALARGVEILEWHADHGVSGAAPLDKRPALLEALAGVSEHKACALVVAKRDRLARDTMTAAMVERLAGKAGAVVVSAAGEGEGDTPEALLMRRMIDAFAEYERAVIASRTRAALATKRARGERVGEVPYGYRLAADGVHLVEHESEQHVIEGVRELRAAGLSLRAIAAELAKRGLLNRRGRPFAHQSVAKILEAAA